MARIFVEKRPPTDPTIYLGDFARSDPSLAPPGGSALYVLAPVPHITPAFDWSREADAYRDLVIGKVKALGLSDIESHIVTEDRWTPLDFAERHNNDRGSIFGLSGKWSQSTFFHPPNRSEEIRGLYFAGGAVIVAGSQCSSALPLTKRQVSNQVVKYSFPGVRGSGYLRGIITVT
jgi:phytoene dehydrogenase-like protein